MTADRPLAGRRALVTGASKGIGGMQETLRTQDPDRVGAFLPARFAHLHATGGLIAPEVSAASLVRRIPDPGNGQVLSVTDPLPDQEPPASQGPTANSTR